MHLAQLAGLIVDNGVVVNASLQTSDPNIFAVGDVNKENRNLVASWRDVDLAAVSDPFVPLESL